LALSSPLAKYDIRLYIFIVQLEISLIAHQARLLGMLEIEAMALGYFPIDCLLDPVDGVDYLVAPSFLHHVDRPLEFSVDHPDEEESLLLQHGDGDLLDGLIA